jgi:hypothetical protein
VPLGGYGVAVRDVVKKSSALHVKRLSGCHFPPKLAYFAILKIFFVFEGNTKLFHTSAHSLARPSLSPKTHQDSTPHTQ